MSNEIVESTEILPNYAVAKHADDKAFDSMSSGAFLPRVQLFGGNSSLCKEGKIGIGCYGLIRSKDNAEDLTAVVDVVPISWRPRAMEVGDGNVVSFFNPASAEFKRIQSRADNVKDSGCFYGPEFLIWVPSASCFATFFFNSKTSRREAPNMKALLGKAATLKSQYIKTKKYSWHGPVITACSTPIEPPDLDAVKEEADKFNNPAETDVEAAPTDTRDR